MAEAPAKTRVVTDIHQKYYPIRQQSPEVREKGHVNDLQSSGIQGNTVSFVGLGPVDSS